MPICTEKNKPGCRGGKLEVPAEEKRGKREAPLPMEVDLLGARGKRGTADLAGGKGIHNNTFVLCVRHCKAVSIQGRLPGKAHKCLSIFPSGFGRHSPKLLEERVGRLPLSKNGTLMSEKKTEEEEPISFEKDGPGAEVLKTRMLCL